MSTVPNKNRIKNESVKVTGKQKTKLDKLTALKALLDGNEQEQKETFDYLKQALKEDRNSERSLFI